MQKIEIKNEELKKIVNLIGSKNYLEAISKTEKLMFSGRGGKES